MTVFALIAIAMLTGFARADGPCLRARNAWKNVSTYQATYRAWTRHEGKVKETLMKYTYQKPGKVRMDIEKPQKGAVVLYDPEVSEKVRVRPFPSMGFMVMKYDLANKRVSSDSGGTIDRSDLGHRIGSVCAEAPGKDTRLSFDGSGLLSKIEKLDAEGKVAESYEWTDLKINLPLPEDTFTKF